MPMTLEQARKMVKGTLKGDSAMAQAIKELIDGEASSPGAETQESAPTGERGQHTLARMRALQDEEGF